MFENLKFILARSNAKEKGYFYALQRIKQLTNKTYYITNCSKGFLGLIARSGYDAIIVGNNVTVKSTNNATVTIPMEDIENELVRIIRK